MAQTKYLVVGSCTGQKDDEGCPEELKPKEADFGTTANLLKAEHRAKDWMKPAGKMYTGRQHAVCFPKRDIPQVRCPKLCLSIGDVWRQLASPSCRQ